MVALAMLSVHKRITGLFRGVVDRFIPDQDEISGDVATIYAHQYELAMQDGQLSARERDMLRLTAKSLGLSRGQAEMIERQFATTLSSAAGSLKTEIERGGFSMLKVLLIICVSTMFLGKVKQLKLMKTRLSI